MFLSKKTTVAAVVVAAVAVLLAGCGGAEHETKKQAAAPAVAASVVKAEERALAASYEATGTVRARVTTVVSARVMGYIREVRAGVGDAVKAGQVLAVVEAREIEAGLRQAEAARNEARGALPEIASGIEAARAQLELADATYKRMKTLLDQKSITPQEFDEVAARRRMAAAQVEMAVARQSQLQQKIRQADEAVATADVMRGYTNVVAPFAGRVVERKAEPGTLAAPGMPILVVEQAGGYRLEVGVEESRLASIRTGMAAEVTLDAADKAIAGRVEEIVPSMDAASRTFTVKIGVAGPMVRSGMFGRARFAAGERRALVVPATAVTRQGQVEKVYVVEGATARARMVTTAAAGEGVVEVLSGLTEGETVVAPVPAAMVDGAKVEVRQ